MSPVVQDEFSITRKKEGRQGLLPYVKPWVPFLILSLVIALFINAAILAKPWIIKEVIDSHLVKKDPGQFNSVVVLAVAYFAVAALGAALVYLQTCLVTWVGQRIMHKLRTDLFSHIQKMSMSFFDKNSTGRLLTRVTNDVEALNDLFSGVIVSLFRDGIMLVGIVAMMFALDSQLALVSLGCIPLIVLVTVVYRIAARKNFIKLKGMISRINGFLAENLSGMKLVQIFHREKEKLEELKELDRQYFRFSFREVLLNGFSRPIVDVINNLAIAVLIVFCFGGLDSGALKIGVIFAFITYIKQFFEPISALSEQYTTIQSAVVSADRIFEILENTENQEDLVRGEGVKHLRGVVEFRNVWFAYEGEHWVLKDVSFTIEAGQTAAFVGTTGSGKSTIISLMGRFYEVQRGSILVDGVDIRLYNLPDLRRQVAVVMQDVFLFNADFEANIRLKTAPISGEQIREAATLTGAHRFIEKQPQGYATLVGERGCSLSSGQRQLVSFARAVAFRPSILILDEATAHIDTETEALLQQALGQYAQERTLIVIAHRLSTIRHADRIFLLHRGRVHESGTHDELMKKDGAYRKLVQHQAPA